MYTNSLRTGFPDFHLNLIDYTHTESVSWLLMVGTGTQTGKFLTIDGTSNEVNYEQVARVRWSSNNKVKEVKIVNDSLTIFQQLGKAIIQENDQEKLKQYFDTLKLLGLTPDKISTT